MPCPKSQMRATPTKRHMAQPIDSLVIGTEFQSSIAQQTTMMVTNVEMFRYTFKRNIGTLGALTKS